MSGLWMLASVMGPAMGAQSGSPGIWMCGVQVAKRAASPASFPPSVMVTSLVSGVRCCFCGVGAVRGSAWCWGLSY